MHDQLMLPYGRTTGMLPVMRKGKKTSNMKENGKYDFRLFFSWILILIAIYVIVEILMNCFIFGYANQSSLTSDEDKLTFLNYLLPMILSIGFIISFILVVRNQKMNSNNIYLMIMILVSGLIAIPWQFNYFESSISSGFDISKSLPSIIAMISTISIMILLIKGKLNMIYKKKRMNSNMKNKKYA